MRTTLAVFAALLVSTFGTAHGADPPSNSSSDDEVQLLRHFRGPISARQRWMENPERWEMIEDGSDKKLKHQIDRERQTLRIRGNSPTLTIEEELEADANFAKLALQNAEKYPENAEAWRNLARVHEGRVSSKRQEIEDAKKDLAASEERKKRIDHFKRILARQEEEKKKKKAESDGQLQKKEEQDEERSEKASGTETSSDHGSVASAPDRLENSPFKKEYEGKGKGKGKGKSGSSQKREKVSLKKIELFHVLMCSRKIKRRLFTTIFFRPRKTTAAVGAAAAAAAPPPPRPPRTPAKTPHNQARLPQSRKGRSRRRRRRRSQRRGGARGTSTRTTSSRSFSSSSAVRTQTPSQCFSKNSSANESSFIPPPPRVVYTIANLVEEANKTVSR